MNIDMSLVLKKMQEEIKDQTLIALEPAIQSAVKNFEDEVRKQAMNIASTMINSMSELRRNGQIIEVIIRNG